MAELRLGNIKPAGDDNVVVDSRYVKGGYVTVKTIAERNGLNGDNGQNIIKGSLCYVSDENMFYRYTGTDWAEHNMPHIRIHSSIPENADPENGIEGTPGNIGDIIVVIN